MMKVKEIMWISRAAKEAELIISDGINSCLAFSQPCEIDLNEKLTEPLEALDIENLMKVVDTKLREKIKRTDSSYYAHHCVAKVIDKEEGIVGIGEIRIDINQIIPSWADEGDLVEFDCSRLDVW